MSDATRRISWLPLIAVLGGSAVGIVASVWSFRSQEPRPGLETQMFQTFQAMEKSSYDAMQSMRKATELLRQLEELAATRNAAIKQVEGKLSELQDQRTLLALTPEQRRALKQLIMKRRSVPEILMSS